MAGSRQGSLAKPLSLLFLTPRPALSYQKHRTLVVLSTLCSLTSKSHFYSPRVLWAAGCIQQLKLHFLQHLAVPGFPQSDHTVSRPSAGAIALWARWYSLTSLYLLSTYNIGRIEEVRKEMSKGREKWDTKIVSLV